MAEQFTPVTRQTFQRLIGRRRPEPGIYVPLSLDGLQQLRYAVYIDADGRAFEASGREWEDEEFLVNYTYRGGLAPLRYAD